MHLADAFIQSDLHCIQVTVFTFLSALAFPGNRTHDLGVASAMLYYLSYRKADIDMYRSLFDHSRYVDASIYIYIYIYCIYCLRLSKTETSENAADPVLV